MPLPPAAKGWHDSNMPAYPFLDSTAEQLIEQDHGLWVYCRCGRHVHMTPEKTFIPLRHLTLYQILGRLRCSGRRNAPHGGFFSTAVTRCESVFLDAPRRRP